MDINEKMFAGTRKLVKNRANATLKKAIKKGRFIFIDSETIRYTNKVGKTKDYTFEEMTKTFIDITGQRENMAQIGMGDIEIMDVILELYKKQEAIKK